MNDLLAEMAAVSSRRKQMKPRRMSGDADSMLSPIDLSTKQCFETTSNLEKNPLEDKSNFLAQLPTTFVNPQQFLSSLCAQLGSQQNQNPSLSTINPHTSTCPIASCSQVFGSCAALTWHLLDVHEDEQEMWSCDSCSTSFSSGQDIREHKCKLSGNRACSVPPTAARSSVCFLSAPATPNPSFSMHDFAATSTADQEEMEDDEPPNADIFRELLARNGGSVSSAVPKSLFGALPQFAAFPHIPPPFLMRQSFEQQQQQQRGDVFSASRHDNDDDWEALMEISTSDETEKIRALVGDKAIPTTDPNQCILCRRVLSCKSALQMHYRTHTGERPFKCKICQRAFTTKGNLKTHMGVHRSKNSFRGLPLSLPPQLAAAAAAAAAAAHQIPQSPATSHASTPILQTQQCPICPKRLSSAAEMAAHIAEHRNSLTQPPRMLPTPPMVTRMQSFPFVPFFPPASLNATDMSSQFNLANILSNQLKTDPSPVPSTAESSTIEEKLRDEHPKMASLSPTNSSESSSSVRQDPESEEKKEELMETSSNSSTSPAEQSATHSKSNENPLLAMQKMWAETEPPPPRQMPVLSKHQCGVCFKHFSSSSALQIHMRTHTGDKPFKCEMCGRAFTTRGNLKVHMGTHAWQQSPSRRGRRIFDVASTGPEKPSILSAPSMVPGASPLMMGPAMPSIEMMMMLWRTVCSVCQKVCSSPTELEQHLKEHLSNSTPPTLLPSATTPPPS